MNFETTPRATDDELAAIERALDRAVGPGATPPQYGSRWLAAALRENAAPPVDEAVDPAYAGRPRNTRGATRA